MSYTLETYDPDDDFDRWYTDETGRRIRERLDAMHARTVLEIGCATGRMTELLAAPGRDLPKRILAVTLDRGMAQRAERRDLPGVEVVCGDVLDIDPPGAPDALRLRPFEAVVCCSVLHEVPDATEILLKARELLAPRGSIFVTVPSATSLHFRGVPEISDRGRQFGVRRLLTPAQWNEVLTWKTGLRAMYRDEMILKPFPQDEMSRLDPFTQAYLARYRGPGGALVYFELVAA